MSSESISDMLVAILGIMLVVLVVLILIFMVLKFKEKSNKKKQEAKFSGNKKQGNNVEKARNANSSYNKQSIFDFMEFEKIEDNMIIQRKGRRFLMVVECQGINYDLMSKMEKVSVEEGFQQFLNTLRHPIQLYIQTRSINLESSIGTYKTKIREIENSYRMMQERYNRDRESGIYPREELDKTAFELTKQKNLLEYGRDLVANTEKMSLNRNVLNKRYFIIIPYFAEDTSKYDFEEIKNMAFSELYTNAQSVIRTLASSSVSGKILSSTELVELLYVAYNRDESEVFGIDKAMAARYDELYSTSTDVFEKKIKALDDVIRQRGIEIANRSVEQVKSRTQELAEEKEGDLEILARKMAEVILSQNKDYVGEEIAEKAIEQIKNGDEEGEETYEEVKTKTTRGRKKSTTSK